MQNCRAGILFFKGGQTVIMGGNSLFIIVDNANLFIMGGKTISEDY